MSERTRTGGSCRIADRGVGPAFVASALAILLAFSGASDLGAAEPAAARPAAPAAKGQAAPTPAQPAASPQAAPTGPAKPATLAEQYCRAVRDAAAEARYAAQVARLEAMSKELEQRHEKIQSRATQLKEWFTKRDEFAQRATAQLVSIYASMRPESASEQLTKMDEVTAAAILSKLEARAASAILNDMPAEKAARLATILAGSSKKADAGDKS